VAKQANSATEWMLRHMKMRTIPLTPQSFGNFLNKKESFILHAKRRKNSKSLMLYFLSDCCSAISTKQSNYAEKILKIYLAYFPYLKTIKTGLLHQLAVWLYVYRLL
jgi:hypothetical protein